ncbi:hypothetical protein [Nocardia nepalensis]|uniref:hypothetical protein n=1 Tax=Nocardia nepalensis TaxID=3375448 RepID=UPI003B67D063
MSIGIALSPFAIDATDNAADAAVALGREAVDVGLSSLWFGQLFTHDTIGLAGIVGRQVRHSRSPPNWPTAQCLSWSAPRRSPSTSSRPSPPPPKKPAALAPRIVAMVPGVVTADIDTARAAATEQMAFYNEIPSYKRMIELSGASHAAELAVIGDEQTLADQITAYFEAGATDVVVAQTDLSTEADRQRTWQVLGDLNHTSSAATPQR